MSRCRPTLQRLWPSPSMGRAAAPLNHGAAAPQHHAQAASRRACVRCRWFALLEGQINQRKIRESGDGAMALDGRRLIGGHNNQLNSVSTVGEISGKARDHGGTYGGAVLAAFGAPDLVEKKTTIKIRRGLKRPPNDKL